VAFPTDTVYGLAALPWNDAAVDEIYRAKGRSTSRPIALLLADAEFVDQVAILPEAVQPLARRFWPGGLSLVLPKLETVSDRISQGPTVGVRVPNSRLALDLIRAAGGILAVTSANRSGNPPALTCKGVLEQLRHRITLVIDGASGGGVPSTVLDCTEWPPVVLREGAVPEEAIRATLRNAGVL
jgi:L-threonylcarbamoyladenylate synthase